MTCRPGPALRLTAAVAALEIGNPKAVEPAVSKLTERFGKDFAQLSRKLCTQAQRRRVAIGQFLELVEGATRHGVRNPGAAFAAGAGRRLPAHVRLSTATVDQGAMQR